MLVFFMLTEQVKPDHTEDSKPRGYFIMAGPVWIGELVG